jgi:hypothetical protein
VRRKPAVSRIVWLCRPEAVVSMDHQRAHIAPSEPLHYGWSRCTAMVPESIFAAFEQLKVS